MNRYAENLFKLSLLSVLVIFCTGAFAQGNLLITPKRVVFEGSKRSEELNLANIGKDTATYVISFIQIRMTEDGQFVQITSPDSAQNFADKNLRFFPRTVTLGPNEAQSIKIQLTKSNELLPGEYRSHLYFRAVPPAKPLGEAPPVNDSVLSVKLTPVFGISMPVIIRKGDSNTQVNLSDLSVSVPKDSTTTLYMTFNRIGNMSVYGDVAVDYIAPDGNTTRVGVIRGLAVYSPTSRRKFHLALDNATGINYHAGKLRVVYNDQSSKPIKLAEEEIALN